MFIIVSGNIGVGKSTIATIFSQITGFEPIFETVKDHPYLEKFYQNPKEFAFKTQAFFLWDRFNKHYEAMKSGKNIIADRSIYEDAIFARVLNERGILDDDDYHKTYFPHFKILTGILKHPNLLIYLQASLDTLMYRIRKRARDMEKNIDKDYIEHLRIRYEEWIENYPYQKLIIETDDIDLTCDLHTEWVYVLEAIQRKLKGKELADVLMGLARKRTKIPLAKKNYKIEMRDER